jgi:hypothetical protein
VVHCFPVLRFFVAHGEHPPIEASRTVNRNDSSASRRRALSDRDCAQRPAPSIRFPLSAEPCSQVT